MGRAMARKDKTENESKDREKKRKKAELEGGHVIDRWTERPKTHTRECRGERTG